MTTRILTILILTAAFGLLFAADSISAEPVMSSDIAELVAGSGDDGFGDSLISVVVFLEDPHQQTILQKAASPTLNRSSRIKSVVFELQSSPVLRRNQVSDYLESRAVGAVRSFWIVPAYEATLSVDDIASLLELEGVKEIISNLSLVFEEPIESSVASDVSMTASVQLDQLGVPELWSRGLTGAGRLVCSFDTGVEWDHPALVDKWRGNQSSLTATWFSSKYPDSKPQDASGHGTHTMGIMVGRDDADTIGVAFDAEWISAGVIDQGYSLSATIADILAAFEWALNPDGDLSTTSDVPDVIVNSWGLPKTLFTPCDGTFWDAIDNIEAAGVVTIFAAGNEGPDRSSMRSPANRASTPTNSFSVGAVSESNQVASFSSRGPSTCGGEIKPEVVAPGMSVRSSYKGGGYRLMSGTSMAAPYIAGMVALARQYNPDATVEEIKNAIMQSAADLGTPGEDNDYGYGLPNAARMIDLLEAPAVSDFTIDSKEISDDGIASLGEQFDLTIFLGTNSSEAATVEGVIAVVDGELATVISNTATFQFGLNQSVASGSSPYTIEFDSSLFHGQTVEFRLYLSSIVGVVLDSLSFSLLAGIAPHGAIATHQTSRLSFSVSDFGQYGLGDGSIYDAGGYGFCFEADRNRLFEAGIIIGTSSSVLSSAVRDSLGQFSQSDFSPVQALSTEWESDDNATSQKAVFSDLTSSLPVFVSQVTTDYDEFGADGFILFDYCLRNESSLDIDSLSFGFLADFDLSDDADQVSFDDEQQVIYQRSADGSVVGLVSLVNVNSFTAIFSNDAKTGLGQARQYELISQSGVNVPQAAAGDWLFVAGNSAMAIEGNDSIQIAFALVAGNSDADFFDNVQAAVEYFWKSTSTGPGETLPPSVVLHQNYPNPFNPSTTIAFDLEHGGTVSLEVFDLLGRKVRDIHSGVLSSGSYEMAWHGNDQSGRSVATGVYFYRLTTEQGTESKKMMLVK